MNSTFLFPDSWKIITRSRTVWFWVVLSGLGSFSLLGRTITRFFSISQESTDSIFMLVLLGCTLLVVVIVLSGIIGGLALLVTICEIEQGRQPGIRESWRLTRQVFWRLVGVYFLGCLTVFCLVAPLSFIATFYTNLSPTYYKFQAWVYVLTLSWASVTSPIVTYAFLYVVIDKKASFTSFFHSIRLVARNIPAVVGLGLLVLAVYLLPMLGPSYAAMMIRGYSVGDYPVFQIYILATQKTVYQLYLSIFNIIFMPFYYSIYTIAWLSFTKKAIETSAALD
jgi:hypothetical protein